MAKYGLIGRSLEHSQSQHLHSLIGDYEYDLIEVAEEKDLQKVLSNTDYDGFNVTSPYKEVIMKYMDEVSDAAKDANAVNIITRLPNGKLKGLNTDIDGFCYLALGRAEDRKCLILGTGGVS